MAHLDLPHEPERDDRAPSYHLDVTGPGATTAPAAAEAPKACCYACGADLEPVFESLPEGSEQFDNALVICLEGGYGMFVDPAGPEHEGRPDREHGLLGMGAGSMRVIICHDCAHGLCTTVPWLDALVKPLESHAHRHGRDWSGHEGWDLPHKDQPA